MADQVIKTGYLVKEGSKVKNWKKRFFVLQKQGLMGYYKNEDISSNSQGSLFVSGVEVKPTDEKPKPFCIKILRSPVLFVHCENKKDMDEWLQAMGKAGAIVKPGKFLESVPVPSPSRKKSIFRFTSSAEITHEQIPPHMLLQQQQQQQKSNLPEIMPIPADLTNFVVSFVDFTDMKELTSGTGGCKLYLTQYKGMETNVLKVFTPPNYADSAWQQFLREVRLGVLFRSQNIVFFNGFCKQEDPLRYGIALEYCEEGDLRQYMLKSKLSWKQKLSILIDVAKGIFFVHAKNHAHLDIKCENILLTKNLVAKITDFGLGWELDVPCTKLVGTSYYICPEMTKAKKVTIKNDVFSFGMLMYEVYTEQIPFKDYADTDKLSLEMAIQMSASFRPNCSGIFPEKHLWYEELMKQCWAHMPNDRPEIKDVIAELNKHSNDE